MSTKFTKEELQKLKEKKRKYYKDRQGTECLYGMGGSKRTSNREDKRGKRRYGFRRYSVKQKHRVNKSLLHYRRDIARFKYRCLTFQSYLTPKEINSLYKDGQVSEIYSLFFQNYSDINKLIVDYNYGYRDILFCRIYSLCGLADKGNLNLFESNYYDLIMDSLVLFIGESGNFIDSKDASFYAYIVNVIPYRISTLFNILRNNPEQLCKNMDIFIDEKSSNLSDIKILGVYLLDQIGFDISDLVKE